MNTHKPMKPQGAGCTAFWGEQAAHLVCIAEVPQAAVKPSTALWQNSRARGRLSCGRGPHHKHGGGGGGPSDQSGGCRESKVATPQTTWVRYTL